MTNAIDKAIGPVAAGMIAQFGTTATMQGGEVSSYDATTGAISQSVQEAEIKVIIGSSTTLSGAGAKSSARGAKPNSQNNSVDQSSLAVTMAAYGQEFAPENGYKITLANKKYSVTSVTPTFSGDDVATYDLVLSL
jgi:hypothetical protein